MDKISENSIQQDDFASLGPCTSSSGNKSNEFNNSVVNGEQEYLSDSDSIYDEFCFPRCEYKTRFKGTSAFQMDKKEYWGTYFRSTVSGGNSDRIAKLNKYDKTYSNANINKSPGRKIQTIPTAKVGTIKSPWIHNEYKQIFNTEFEPKEFKKINKNNGTLLYDQLLQYKAHICTTVVSSFSALKIPDKKIDVYFENDYPCILVQIKEFARLFEQKIEIASLYKIVIAYFTAITNNIAQKHKIPIELVNRASFGHNIPSVAVTGKSFRINIGIVPNIYAAEVLPESLESLNNQFLVPLLSNDTTKTLKLGFTPEEIGSHNKDVTIYNHIKMNKRYSSTKQYLQAEMWRENETLFTVLCKVGDSSGRKVSFQITRCNAYIDLLTDYVTKYLQCSNTCTSNLLYTKPLTEILKTLTYKSRVTLEIKKDDYYNRKLKFRDEENPSIKGDDKFWKTLLDISSIFESLDINMLSSIKSRKINGLYSMLERANLEFVKHSNIQLSEDGFGSDSDCEVSVEDTTFYSRKITVSTGMRAINLAHFLLLLFRSKNFDVHYMYYEVGDVLKNLVYNVSGSYLFNQTSEKLEHDIFDTFLFSQTSTGVRLKYIDLNHCAACNPNDKVELKEIQHDLYSVKAIVLDYTSATTAKISEAISLFIPKVPLLFLVNSGIKNEQIGADMNPYGTLRVIAKKQKNLNKLFYILKAHLIAAEILPSESHNIRKAYKTAGAVVTSADIYKKERGYNYKPNTNKKDNSKYYDIETNKLPDEMKKIVTLFSSEYEDKINNLIQYGKSLDNILQWDFNKIEFLGCNNVSKVLKTTANLLDRILSEVFEKLETSYDNGDDYEKRKIALDGYFFNEVFMLTTEYDQSEEEILNWDLNKVEYLGSTKIFHLLSNLWPSDIEDNFNEIEFSYDSDKDFTSHIVDIILQVQIENYQSTELNFNELAERYIKAKKRNEGNILTIIDDKDIIENILFNDTYDEDYQRVGFAYYKLSGLIDSGCSTPQSNSCESMDYENNSISNSNSDDDSNQSSSEAMYYENN